MTPFTLAEAGKHACNEVLRWCHEYGRHVRPQGKIASLCLAENIGYKL